MTTTDTPSTVTVKFFARLRETLQTDELEVPVTNENTVADIIQHLASRGAPWDELTGEQPVMIAVNQSMARTSHRLAPGDEVALFPPVTGG